MNLTTGLAPLAMLVVFGGACLLTDDPVLEPVRPVVGDAIEADARIPPALIGAPVDTDRYAEPDVPGDPEPQPDPTVDVRVESLRGTPAPGIPIHVLASEGDAHAWQASVSAGQHGDAVGTTDPEGVASIPLPSGRAHVLIKGPGARWWLVESVTADRGPVVVRLGVTAQAKATAGYVQDELRRTIEQHALSSSERDQVKTWIMASHGDVLRKRLAEQTREAILVSSQRTLRWRNLTASKLKLDRVAVLNGLGLTGKAGDVPVVASVPPVVATPEVELVLEPEPAPPPPPAPHCLPTRAWSSSSSLTWYVWELFPPTV